jgi:hypothetical protein
VSKVNVRLGEFFTAPGFVPVRVRSVLVNSLAVISGSTGVLPGEVIERTDATGLKQFDLRVGRYEITATSSKVGASGLMYRAVIDVPDDNLTYEHTELIAEGAGTFTPVVGGGSPDAAEATAGLVKLAAGADLEAAPRVLYTKAQVDALVSGVAGGALKVNTVALLRAVSSALSAVAGAAFVWGNAALGDGLGGVYRWDGSASDADDGMGVIRPSDFAAAGVWKKFI